MVTDHRPSVGSLVLALDHGLELVRWNHRVLERGNGNSHARWLEIAPIWRHAELSRVVTLQLQVDRVVVVERAAPACHRVHLASCVLGQALDLGSSIGDALAVESVTADFSTEARLANG